MQYRIELEREEDGRWLADVVDLPGVMGYGDTPDARCQHRSHELHPGAAPTPLQCEAVDGRPLRGCDATGVPVGRRPPMSCHVT